MRKLMIAGLMGIGFLLGCGAKTTALVIYKEQVSYLDGNQALLECQVKAAQTVPVSNNIYTTPTWTTPISCSVSSGRTSCSGGITYSGNIITQDSNTGAVLGADSPYPLFPSASSTSLPLYIYGVL
jgi:hypothetical protein